MRTIQLIEAAMKHNELLVKMIKGELWFQDKSISDEKKLSESERYVTLTKKLSESCSELENNGITFNELEAIEVIELPEALKRKDVEIWLEKWRDFNNKQYNQERMSM
jgi:hypothetical protein